MQKQMNVFEKKNASGLCTMSPSPADNRNSTNSLSLKSSKIHPVLRPNKVKGGTELVSGVSSGESQAEGGRELRECGSQPIERSRTSDTSSLRWLLEAGIKLYLHIRITRIHQKCHMKQVSIVFRFYSKNFGFFLFQLKSTMHFRR